MKVGDLVRVKNCTTGDNADIVRLYRERVPLLLMDLDIPYSFAMVLVGETRRLVPAHRLEVISESR